MATALDQLRWALQALAAPADQQVQLFPSFVCIPDELVLDFDQWFRATTRNAEFSSEQQTALAQLDESIAAWSGPAHADVWLEAALATHPAWFDFRSLARDALASFGWLVELPPPDRGAIYVGN